MLLLSSELRYIIQTDDFTQNGKQEKNIFLEFLHQFYNLEK